MTTNNKTALVTGASGGMGREFALQLAEKGYNLVLVARNREKLTSLAQTIQEHHGVKTWVIPLDLAKPDSPRKLYNSCVKQKLTIDVLINNAGRGMVGPVTSLDVDEMNGLIALNCQSLFSLAALFAADMKKRGSGRILNVGSMVGLQPVPYFAPYAASKSFVTSLSISMTNELKASGVTVTCLVPGFMSTGFEESAGITNETYLKVSNSSAMAPGVAAAIGLKALFRGKTLVVAGFTNRAGAFFSALFPQRLTAWLLEKSLQKLV